MPSSTKNVKLGVCRVYFKGVDLGLTKGGVEVQVGTEKYTVEVDQFGKTPIKDLVQGRTCTATVPLVETTIQNMGALMPGSRVVTDGKQAKATIKFTSIPVADDEVKVGNKTLTFSAGTASTSQVLIAPTLKGTLENLVAAVGRSMALANLGGVTATFNGTDTVTFTAVEYGEGYNDEVVTCSSNGVTETGKLAGGVPTTKMRLIVKSGAGIDLLDHAGELRLHPMDMPEDDLSDDFIILRAAAPGELNFAYKVDAERVFNANFSGYAAENGDLFTVGDPNAVEA